VTVAGIAYCLQQKIKNIMRSYKIMYAFFIYFRDTPCSTHFAHINLTIYQAPRARVLEKLTDAQLAKKFPTFHGTYWFNTTFMKACYGTPSHDS
jgi:hypothetical protein